MRWRGLHGYEEGSRRSRGLSFGSSWKNGQCVADIARALERRNKSGVYRILAVNGGIAPEPRRRAVGALRLEEREEISRGSGPPPVARYGGSHWAFDDRPRLSARGDQA